MHLVTENPFDLFDKWFNLASSTNQHEPLALCFSRSGMTIKPLARYVYLKSYDEKGMIFCSNQQILFNDDDHIVGTKRKRWG